jgi:hypothetical protein
MLDQIDAELARRGGPGFSATPFSVVDPYAFVLCAGRAASLARRAACRTSRPGSSACSPARRCRRAFATEQLAAPFV